MRHMFAKTYHLLCVHFSCVVALLRAQILSCLYIKSAYLIVYRLYILLFSFFKKTKPTFSCNKSISLIALMLLLFKSIYAEGNTDSRKRKKKKKKRNLIRPLLESNPRCLTYKADTPPLSKKHMHIHTESVTRELPRFRGDSKSSLI